MLDNDEKQNYMAHYPKKLQDLLESLSMFSEDSERINLLVDYADKLETVPSEIAQKPYPDENKVPFCESGAYVWTKKRPDNTLKFYFIVENPQGISAKALSSILNKTLSGEKPENILQVSEDIVYKLFGQNLSMGKNMGLSGIIQMVKRDAKNI